MNPGAKALRSMTDSNEEAMKLLPPPDTVGEDSTPGAAGLNVTSDPSPRESKAESEPALDSIAIVTAVRTIRC